MFYVLSKLLDVFLSPYTWGLGLVGVALPWRRPRRATLRRRRVCAVCGMFVLVIFALEPVSNGMLYRLEHVTRPTIRADVVYDAVVLLGGISDEIVVHEQGGPAYNDNVERLVETHRLLAADRARSVIITGGAVDAAYNQFNEARVLGAQLERWGIARERIILEEQARNTRENAVFARDLAAAHGFRTLLVVTSAFHMRRSVECFEAVGLSVDTLAVDYRAHRAASSWTPRASHLAESTGTLREFFGLYVYRFRGYAKPRT